eukprot:31244-Pelagococcus_subviridis.AAC.6
MSAYIGMSRISYVVTPRNLSVINASSNVGLSSISIFVFPQHLSKHGNIDRLEDHVREEQRDEKQEREPVRLHRASVDLVRQRGVAGFVRRRRRRRVPRELDQVIHARPGGDDRVDLVRLRRVRRGVVVAPFAVAGAVLNARREKVRVHPEAQEHVREERPRNNRERELGQVRAVPRRPARAPQQHSAIEVRDGEHVEAREDVQERHPAAVHQRHGDAHEHLAVSRRDVKLRSGVNLVQFLLRPRGASPDAPLRAGLHLADDVHQRGHDRVHHHREE